MTDEVAEVRCPECGARNTPQAQWCTQCFTPLGAAAEEAHPTGGDAAVTDPAATDPAAADPTAIDPTGDTGPAEGGPPGDPATPPPPPPPPPDAPADPVAGAPDGLLPPPPPGPSSSDDVAPSAPRQLRSGGGRFRETEQGLEWSCRVCQEWNSIDRLSCSVCATPFGRTLGAESEPERPDVAPAVLTIASLVLPGAGHWLLHMRGAAVLRALLGLVWGLGGLTLFLRARASGQSFLPAIPLLLGWAVVAAGSANDAVVEAGGSGSRVLEGRVLLWLTLAVVGGTFAAVLVGVLSAVGQ